MNSEIDKLGGIIKSARLVNHLTRKQLAIQIGISPRYLIAIENENQKPSYELLERIRDWVGHSDIRTTVNTYGHLEYQSKKETAAAIQSSLPLKMVGAMQPI